MKNTRKILFLLLACTEVVVTLGDVMGGEIDQFVIRRGDKLSVGEKDFRFISFNIPNLHLVEDNFSFTRPNPWRWPNEYEIADALESVRQMGGTVVRIYVLSVRRENSDMGDHVFVRGPGDFNEHAFQVLDRVLAIARKKGIRVIIPLVDNWHWWGGRADYAKFRGKEPDDFWTDEQLIADFETTIRHTLSRKNSIDGVAYKNDPAIFGWETGNELDSTPEWTRRISALIKSVDPNHLVIDGYSLHGVRQESLDDPNIDVITTHHYPNTDQDYVEAILNARRATKGLKPYFVGEFGFVPTAELRRVLDTVVEHEVSGALLWSLRFHNRDGGFYWHWETASKGLYKAYHWPGFNSGAKYDERQVLTLMRNKAFEIRGELVPQPVPPTAPHLLPIVDIGAISWQGSAGAESYDVERSESARGPWRVIGKEVSDAHVQYRPLFNDESAAVGQSYFYRVTARNAAGVSPPSNVVGPVKSRWRVLVDECLNFELLASHRGNVAFAGDNERKTQEDTHRLRLMPESSVTYRVDESITGWRVFLFSGEEAADVIVESSKGGQAFSQCQTTRQAIPVGTGDYGYSKPVLLEGSIDTTGVRFLRISVQAKRSTDADKGSVQLSRVEIKYGWQRMHAPAQLKSGSRGASLNPSILLFHKPHQTDGVAAVQRAADLKNHCVNVVVTMLCEIDEDRQVVGYGVLRRGKWAPLDEPMLAEFQETIRRTFAAAVAQDMDIAVLAHLNSWGEIGDWRNKFQFDPQVKYGDYTYQQALIDPIVNALRATATPTIDVEISLAGEMGHSVFSHAKSYRQLMAALRRDNRLPSIKLGVSLNFNRVASECQPTRQQQSDAQEFIDRCDFVGLSNYRGFDLPPKAANFANAVDHFLKAMQNQGVVIPDEMPLHFSEVGIGGCTEGGHLTDSPKKAAKTPWKGSDDVSRNPWDPPPMRKLRLDFHRALLDFLKHQPAKHRVTRAFLWSEGSWDPMDIAEAGFADAEIITLIQQHNNSLEGQ